MIDSVLNRLISFDHVVNGENAHDNIMILS